MSQSVPHLMLDSAATLQDKCAALQKENETWVKYSWNNIKRESEKAAAGLLALGVQRNDRIAIISKSCLMWSIADLGILASGCTTVPIYQTTLPKDAAFILNDASVKIAFVQDRDYVNELEKIKPQTPGLEKIICLEDWQEFITSGLHYLENSRSPFESIDQIQSDDIATIVYTSGTTGAPKGAMLTHANLLYEAHAIEKLGLLSNEDVQLLFLPLAHIFAKILQIAWLKTGHELVYAESIEKVVDNMAETRPTIMAAVPRIFEKVHAKVVSNAISGSPLKVKLAKWALEQEAGATRREINDVDSHSLSWSLAQKLVFSKVGAGLKEKFGGRLRFFVSGGAPLSEEIAYFFKHAGVTICEGYGLTETSAATCMNLPSQLCLGSVGKPVPGTEIKIAEDGEILIRGQGVFKGYWNNEAATKEAFDSEGFFHTGDIGVLSPEGFLKITDRKKDIIVTAGGKNIAPQKIENLLKSRCSLVSQVVVHGDKRKFLSALIAVDEAALMPWAEARKLNGSYAELVKHERVRSLIDRKIAQINKKHASYEQIKKFEVLEKDFAIGEELTPTLKVKRNFCSQKYASILENFYAD